MVRCLTTKLTPLPLENVRLPNDTKIRFMNAMFALRNHAIPCEACAEYYLCGVGDLCAKGKDIIARELAYAETNLEFPPNEKLSDASDAFAPASG